MRLFCWVLIGLIHSRKVKAPAEQSFLRSRVSRSFPLPLLLRCVVNAKTQSRKEDRIQSLLLCVFA
jgi:hypothetical protein